MSTPTSDLSHMTVAIQAGGLGKRLRPAVKDKPKVLAQINNHPFLEYILLQLSSEGFKDVVLCTGYLGDQIEKAFGGKYRDLSLKYSVENKTLGTAGSLRNAIQSFKSGTVLVINGDTFCEIDFNKFWQFHVRKKSAASLIFSKVPNPSRFGTVKLDQNNKIVKFEEKKPGDRHGFVSAGVYLINKTLISKIPEGQKISLEKEMFPKWIGKEFYGFKVENEFIDIGTPESYKSAQEFFAKFKLK